MPTKIEWADVTRRYPRRIPGGEVMGEMGEFWRDVKQAGRSKRANNLEYAEARLKEAGIAYTKLSPHHFRVGNYDFWPSTGLFINRTTREKRRGLKNLIKRVGR